MVTIIIIVTTIISIVAFKDRSWLYRLSLNPYSVKHRNQLYRIITSAFVHSDYTHLFVNMFVLWSFGSNIESSFDYFAKENMIGNPTISFLLLYFGGVVFSSVPDIISKKTEDAGYNSIGASGGVSAVLFASIFLSPWTNLYFLFIIPIPKILFGIGFIIYSYYMSRKGTSVINHKAHLWGALYGIVYLSLLNFKFINHFINKLF